MENLQSTSKRPETVDRVINAAQAMNLNFSIHHVDSGYYEWSLEERANVLSAESTSSLCKTVLFENTKWNPEFGNNRYCLILVQYEDQIKSQKLNNFIKDSCGLTRKQVNMRVPSEDIALEVTGYATGGICPFGVDLPLFVTENISQIKCDQMYLGAGHVDWKIGFKVSDFLSKSGCTVLDLA